MHTKLEIETALRHITAAADYIRLAADAFAEAEKHSRAAAAAWPLTLAVAVPREGVPQLESTKVASNGKAEYVRKQDHFAAWADGAFKANGDPASFTPTMAIVRDYRRWCEVNGKRPFSVNILYGWLRDNAEALGITRGCRQTSPSGARARGWAGLRLRARRRQ
jgi:hypothetical protein